MVRPRYAIWPLRSQLRCEGHHPSERSDFFGSQVVLEVSRNIPKNYKRTSLETASLSKTLGHERSYRRLVSRLLEEWVVLPRGLNLQCFGDPSYSLKRSRPLGIRRLIYLEFTFGDIFVCG